MSVFGELFNDLTGWLTIGVLVFMLMMAYLFSMFINKSAKHDNKTRILKETIEWFRRYGYVWLRYS